MYSRNPRVENMEPTVCFDDEYRIRVLDVEKYKHTQELEAESNQFINSNCSYY